ncbi:MAG: FAD:protein FMN transferase [Ruminococcus sp.]|nr:FAD:protein FMN transferase [Ruminococcus sp.]
MLWTSGCSKAGESAVSAAEDGGPQSISVFAMDTYMQLTAYDGQKSAALSQAKDEVERLEKLWSVTDEGSEIYRLDHSGGEPAEISDETAELIAFGMELNELTGGAFDISLYPVLSEWGFTNGDYKIPSEERLSELLKNVDSSRIELSGNAAVLPDGMSIDLGALGKGETGDRITEIFRANGVSSALLDLGGNIQVIGSKPDGSPWKIGIKSPWGEGSVAKLEVRDCCVITSGGYERFFEGGDGEIYWHILDPKTGYPAKNGILSATVIGKSGRLCDGLSTSLFVLGEEGAKKLWRERGDFDMILITEDGRLIMTEGIAGEVSLYEEFSGLETEVMSRD